MKDSIIRISITLLDVDPAIWRRIEVPASMTLEGLHDVIQVVMGGADYHLHHFQFGDVMYGAPTPEDREMNDGRKVKLSTALVDGERVFQYLYDYGDGWCCVVVLEAVAPTVTGVAYPRLVEGARTRASRGCRRALGLWRVPGGHRGRKARASHRTAGMVRRRLRPPAVRYRRNQSSSGLARAPQDHPPQDREAGRRLILPVVLTGRVPIRDL